MKRDGHKLIFTKTKSLEHFEGIFEIKHKKRPFEIISTSKLRDWENSILNKICNKAKHGSFAQRGFTRNASVRALARASVRTGQ